MRKGICVDLGEVEQKRKGEITGDVISIIMRLECLIIDERTAKVSVDFFLVK